MPTTGVAEALFEGAAEETSEEGFGSDGIVSSKMSRRIVERPTTATGWSGKWERACS